MKYAIISKTNGILIDYCNSIEEANYFINKGCILIETAKASKIEVIYTELGCPTGYGHQEPSFITYGSINNCICNLIKWMQQTTRTFGPNSRYIREFFGNCRLYVNNIDKSNWLFNQMNKFDRKTLYV